MTIQIRVQGLEYQPSSNVRLSYPDFEICRGDSLSVEGPNGVGKTSLLFLLAGLHSPVEKGAIVFYDADGKPATANHAVSFGLALPEVGENRDISGRVLIESMRGISKITRQEVQEILNGSGIEEFWNLRFGQMSTGQKARIRLAEAFISYGDVILLDEPTNGLDEQGVQWLQKSIDSSCKRGQSVLVTVHDNLLKLKDKLVIGAKD